MIQSGIFANQKDLSIMRSNPNLAKGGRTTCNLIVIEPFRSKYKLPSGSVGVDLRTGEFLLQKWMEKPK